ncbi:hypothetical protein ACFC3F_05700 [Microbacterium sp. NPDC055910]|uniref:hypothetical protein n=1 Tax=Microbacterium sp. NPDC055910 TaxID=3345659 RepID=UPI0035D61696
MSRPLPERSGFAIALAVGSAITCIGSAIYVMMLAIKLAESGSADGSDIFGIVIFALLAIIMGAQAIIWSRTAPQNRASSRGEPVTPE